MPQLAILIGILLDILGIVGYMATGAHAPTALIPAVLGTLLIILGIVAIRNPELSRHAMHGAAALAALGLLAGAARALPNLSRVVASSNPLLPAASGSPGHVGITSDQFSSPGPTGTPGHLGGLEQVGALDHAHLIAFWMQTAMALLSLVFLIFCIKSFMEARNRKSNSYPYNRVP